MFWSGSSGGVARERGLWPVLLFPSIGRRPMFVFGRSRGGIDRLSVRALGERLATVIKLGRTLRRRGGVRERSGKSERGEEELARNDVL